MGSVAVASSSQLAADAGAAVAAAGGNAVDTAIGASLVSVNTEPGVCALGCAGYVTVWPAQRAPITIDGYAAVPGLGLPRQALGGGGVTVTIPYGGGVTSIVGPGSVAVPGGLAALAEASACHGVLPWRTLFEPALAIADEGFPMPAASYHYLIHSADCVFGLDAVGWQCLHESDGSLKKVGSPVRVPHLAETLERLADLGAEEFYRGELAHHIADSVLHAGGSLTRDDLASYRPITRDCLCTPVSTWEVATNPAPAIGGVMLSAMLKLIVGDYPDLPEQPVERQIAVQRLVLGYRRRRLDYSRALERDLASLMSAVDEGSLRHLKSPSTVHTSAVDSDGLACAITMSTGYGSGLMPKGTGIWLNNCLGELELNPHGLSSRRPGERLPSNMAPTVAREREGAAIAIGSPGADRITTALAQVLVQHLHLNVPLERAVASPRVHLEFLDERMQVAHEPGVSLPEKCPPGRPFSEPSMYFGGVGIVRFDRKRGLEAVADPRRAGGTRVVSR